MRNLFKKRKKHEDLFFFMHIMKTGGTSFRKMLVLEFGEKWVYPNDKDLSSLPNKWYPPASSIYENLNQLRMHKVLSGHYSYTLYNYLNPQYKVISFLREPISRTISMLGETKRTRLGETKRTNSEALYSIYEDLLDDEKFVKDNILNYQTKVFGMPFWTVTSPYETNNNILQIAISNLKKCAFIGIKEYFELSCKLFDKKFNTNLHKKILYVNVNKNKMKIPDKLIGKIEPLILLDKELYKEALELLIDESNKLKLNRTV